MKANRYFSKSCFFLFICLIEWMPSFAKIISCDQTPYPDVCNYFIGASVAAKDQFEAFPSLFTRSLSITADLAMQAQNKASSMAGATSDPRATVAWSDCSALLSDTVDMLGESLTTTDADYAQSLLSAAVANQETCKNGFADFGMGSTFSQLSPQLMTNISSLISNALAINNRGRFPLAATLPRGRKLLANDEFPSWVSASDRKLLQTAAAPSADAVVAADGSGDYGTISAAVAAAASRGGSRFVIHVKAGVYKENVVISKKIKNIMIVGDGQDVTVITGNKNAGTTTTFRSATFAVMGQGFIARDITFENTAGPQNHQAVALRSGSDHSVFYSCSFKGYQDTLYVYAMRQYYRNCNIYGTVDFIFGDAAAVFQGCNIYIRNPMSGQKNTVTAQGRVDPNENTGIVIHSSTIQGDSGLKSGVPCYLGRPWQKYSRTVIMKTAISGAISPAGWLPWSGNFALSTLYYAEYMNTGAGADTSGRVGWGGYHVLNSEQASGFTVGNFIAGESWLPSTGVPFDSGL